MPLPKLKYCHRCLRGQTREEYGAGFDKPPGTPCNACIRREKEKKQEAKKIHHFKKSTTEIRKSESITYIKTLLDKLIRKLGGVNKLTDYWINLISDPYTPETTRLKSLETITKLAQAAEQDQSIDFNQINPTEYLNWLNKKKQLAPLIRELMDQGKITINQIDPPPWTML